MISEIDFLIEHLYNVEKDFKELLIMICETHDIECENAEKLNKIYCRNFMFYCEKYFNDKKKA